MTDNKNGNSKGGNLVVLDPIQYAITEMDPHDLKEIIEGNLGGETLGPNDLERITVPPGGVKVWTLQTAQGEINETEIEGVIVAQKTTRVYWAGDFSGGGTPPDCFSDDGEWGIGNPGGSCETCPYAEFGSKETGGGRAQACKQNKLLFVVFKDEILPRIISVPPTSLQEAKRYILRSVSSMKPLYAVTTKFTLEAVTNADQVKYGKIRFTQGAALNAEDAGRMKAYADMMSPTLKRVRGDRPESTYDSNLEDGPEVIEMDTDVEPVSQEENENVPAD